MRPVAEIMCVDFTPIIKMPEWAILFLASVILKPVARPNRAVKVRDMVTLSLSFEHRSTDGTPAARSFQFIAELILSLIHI